MKFECNEKTPARPLHVFASALVVISVRPLRKTNDQQILKKGLVADSVLRIQCLYSQLASQLEGSSVFYLGTYSKFATAKCLVKLSRTSGLYFIVACATNSATTTASYNDNMEIVWFCLCSPNSLWVSRHVPIFVFYVSSFLS